MTPPTRSQASLLGIAALALTACGGGGASGAARIAPTIANLELTPRIVYENPTPQAFSVEFDLFDPNRDVTSVSFELLDASGQLVDQQTLPITANAANVRIQGAAFVPVPQPGTFTLEIWTTDASGLASNALVTTVAVVPYPWSALPPDLVVRRNAAAVALDDQVYVIGGSRQDLGVIPGPSTPIVARLDPTTGTWTAAAELGVPRRALAAAVADGRIYAIGGESTPLTQPIGASVATVEQYDPATTTWTLKAPMPTARHDIAAATLGGRIYVIGGTTGGNPLATVESYDPLTDSWRSEPDLLHARYGARAAAFGGRLVVAGGQRDQNNCENRVSVFDPATGLWSSSPDANLCATWLAVTAGQLFVGVGAGLAATDASNPIAWRGLTASRSGSSLESAAAATADAIFVFGETGAERYLLAREIN